MWSGGKDSALALLRARARGLHIARLVNFYDPSSGRVRFHATRRELIQIQADAMSIELRQHGSPWEHYERTFRGVLADLVADGFTGIVFGDIHLADFARGTKSACARRGSTMSSRCGSSHRTRSSRSSSRAVREP